jgi:hypothetical protein
LFAFEARSPEPEARILCGTKEGFSPSEVRIHELVTTVFGAFQDGGVPGIGAVCDPVVVLAGDVAEMVTGNRVDVPIGAEEADDSLGLLKGLDAGVEYDSIKTAIMKTDVILMMLVKGVHGNPPVGLVASWKDSTMSAFAASWGWICKPSVPRQRHSGTC